MSATTDFESSFKSVFEALKEMEAESESRRAIRDGIAHMHGDNLKLKERNICLEKKLSELQSKLERMEAQYQSAVLAGQKLKNMQETVLKSAPKQLEEENAALTNTIAQMEIKLFHASEESRKYQENWKLHQQKMDRLVDLIGQLMSKQSNFEKRLTSMSGICNRIRPAAEAVAHRSAALHLAHQHGQCQLDKLAARLSELRRQAVAKDAQLETARARLQALEDETAAYRSAMQEHRDEAVQSKQEIAELQAKLEHLQSKLAEAQDTMRDQSELLSRMYCE